MKNIMEMPIIRLNGSSYINDMELKERYKVYNDSCWISLLSLVGNPDGAIVTVDEPVSPLLTMDLEKRLKTALEEDPADFLVVDMCYTAGHRLCVWKDQVFTKNPKFEESRFYAEHQDEMEEIDVMRDRNFDWKPYMDRYLELISKYFDKDHIILIKSRCPKWFATHTHVRKVQKKSSKAYNRRIKELEDYFVEKTDPYVIDIYSHYFLDFNHKRDIPCLLTRSHFIIMRDGLFLILSVISRKNGCLRKMNFIFVLGVLSNIMITCLPKITRLFLWMTANLSTI
ncbi:MAG: DUF6270 domain-containing protein [Eubacterium sp.]